MGETKWALWLRTVTKEDSVRGIARAAKVSHTTVQRWIAKGVPVETVWELTLRFNADPIAALILLERIAPSQTGDLNYSAIVKYAPEHTLTSELHRRAMDRHMELLRSDVIPRPAFRLSAKRNM